MINKQRKVEVVKAGKSWNHALNGEASLSKKAAKKMKKFCKEFRLDFEFMC